jgi:hypothetical protein
MAHCATANVLEFSFNSPMDIRFSVFDSVVMPIEQWPTGLQKYLSDLQFLCVRTVIP